MVPSAPACWEGDRLRMWALVVVALVAFLAGYICGVNGGQSPGGSRIDWPAAPTNPRSFNP